MTKKLRITYGVLAVLAAAICLCTVVYTDHLILSEFGYKYIDSVFRGNFPALFKEQSWSYGFTIYTIYAIWSIPVWIVFQLFHISGLVSEYALAVLWYKIMLAAFAAFSVYLLDRIAARVYKDEQHDAALQYICSPLFLLIVFYVAQCDIIGLSFVLLGVYYFLGGGDKGLSEISSCVCSCLDNEIFCLDCVCSAGASSAKKNSTYRKGLDSWD